MAAGTSQRPDGWSAGWLVPSATTTSDRRVRAQFLGRLLGSLLVALVLLAALQFLLLRHRLVADEVNSSLTRQQQVAQALSRAFYDAPDDDDPFVALQTVLSALDSGHDVDEAIVVKSNGVVLASLDPARVGTTLAPGPLRGPLGSGTAAVSTLGGGRWRYTVPFVLPAGRVNFIITQRDASLAHAVHSLQVTTAEQVALGLLIAVPVFYVLGGAALARAHVAAHRRSTRDGLTDLDNHRSFQEELRRALALSVRSGQPLSLAVIDVDEFKAVNDRRGHRHGDAVLISVADHLSRLRAADRAFRIGGDEFALLMPHTDAVGARNVLDRLRTAVAHAQDGLTLSIGVSSSDDPTSGAEPEGVLEAEDLWQRADAAVYEAKRGGRDQVVLAREIEGNGGLSVTKVRALRRLLTQLATEPGLLSVAFQPIWDLPTSGVLGHEALTRLPVDCGLNGPGEAFEVAAHIGRVAELDRHCRAAILARAGRIDLGGGLLFLNVTPQSLAGGALTPAALVAEVRAAGLRPEQLVIEVTEQVGARPGPLLAAAQALREAGLALALDDVGSGNNGLEMLRDLAVDYVKVDQGVLMAAAAGSRSALGVFAAIVAFATRLDSYVIAEGIETHTMLDLLSHLPESAAEPAIVRGAQGYLLGRPGPEPWSGPDPFSSAADRTVLAGLAGLVQRDGSSAVRP